MGLSFELKKKCEVMENLWANAMSGGKEVKVKVKIKVIFDGNSKRSSK